MIDKTLWHCDLCKMVEFLSVWKKGSVSRRTIRKLMDNLAGVQQVKTQRQR